MTWNVNNSGNRDVDADATKLDGSNNYCIANSTAPAGTIVGPLAQECGGNPPFDCSAVNCNFFFPEWDGDDSSTTGDPSFGGQTLTGATPETITVRVLAPGDYLFSAAFFTDGETANVVAEIFLDGFTTPAFTRTFEMSDAVTWQEIARVVQPASGPPCIEDLTDGTNGDTCP